MPDCRPNVEERVVDPPYVRPHFSYSTIFYFSFGGVDV